MSKPRCPECEGVIGVLVHYQQTKIHSLELGPKGDWGPGRKVLESHPVDVSETAETPVVCLKCDWMGPDSCAFHKTPEGAP